MPRFLARLHREEFRVRLTSEPMQVGASDVLVDPSSLPATNNDHIDGFDDAVQALSAEYGRTPIATGTGTESGQHRCKLGERGRLPERRLWSCSPARTYRA